MNSPRVAFILGEHPCPSETFIAREIDAVRRQGVDVCVFALRGRGEQGAAAVLSPAARLTSLLWLAARPRAFARGLACALGRPSPALRTLRKLPAAAALARGAVRCRAACIHAHFAGEPGTVARIAARIASLPYTLSIHARDIFVDNPALIHTIDEAQAVAACTRAAADRARSLARAGHEGKVHLVRHGLDAAAWRTDAPRGREPVVLMVARLVEKKGAPVLLAAMKSLRDRGRTDLRCVILGDGPLRPRLEGLCRELRLEAAVRLQGWATQEAVRDWMGRAAVLAVPSVVAADGDRDGLPNVILEAAAAGLPIVASGVGGIGEFVSHESTGLLVAPADPGALAGAIGRALDDERLRSRLVQEARRRVLEEYDPDVNAGLLVRSMGWMQ